MGQHGGTWFLARRIFLMLLLLLLLQLRTASAQTDTTDLVTATETASPTAMEDVSATTTEEMSTEEMSTEMSSSLDIMVTSSMEDATSSMEAATGTATATPVIDSSSAAIIASSTDVQASSQAAPAASSSDVQATSQAAPTASSTDVQATSQAAPAASSTDVQATSQAGPAASSSDASAVVMPSASVAASSTSDSGAATSSIQPSPTSEAASSSYVTTMSSTPDLPTTTVPPPPDPCQNYTTVEAADNRSTAFPAGEACDDGLQAVWYRFVGGAGEDIPTNNLCSSGSCGTNATICLKDTGIPSVAEGEVNRTVCRNGDSKCESEWDIQVKNCGAFRVYFLPVPQGGCPAAYCVGTQAKCPEGQCSETGYTPNCDVCPSNIVLEPNVTVSTETALVGTTQTGTIVFSCDFETEAANASQYRYDVFWYIDNVQVVNFTGVETASLQQTRLKEEHWSQLRLGMTVNCSARVKFSYSNSSSRHFYSAGFYAGLELENSNSLTVNEGERVTLRVRSTVPVPYTVGAGGERQGGLLVSVTSDASSGSEPACSSLSRRNIGLPQECGVRLHVANYSEWVEVSVWGMVDNLYTGDRSATLKIGAGEATPSVAGRRLWTGHTLPDVQVTVQDRDTQIFGRICQSFDDPHMATLDGNWWENQREEEFILYKHKTLPLAVHTKYKRFWSFGRWAPTLNCAVAIRAFSSLLVLDRCSSITIGSISRPRNYVSYRNCQANHLTITRSRYTFKVTLPTGTAVQFNVFPFYTPGIGSVSVFPSVADLGNSAGLCGLMDGDSSNDFTLRNGTSLDTSSASQEIFANDWRASNAESLFVDNPDLSGAGTGASYCACETSGSLCGLPSPAKRCPQTQDKAVNAFLQHCSSSRRRRDVHPSDLVSDGPSGWEDFSQSLDSELDRERRAADTVTTTEAPEWGGGWNESLARQRCEATFNESQGVGLLESASGLGSTKDQHIAGCIEDIKLSGGDNFTAVTVEVFKETVLEAVQRNETLKQSQAGAAILQNIQLNSCPKDCSGQGICNETCQCNSGFTGQDCSIDKRIPPTNPYIPNDGLCDLSNRTCSSTPVLADNLPEDGDVTCRFQKFTVSESGQREITATDTTTALPYLVGEVECPFPNATSSSRRKRQATSSPAPVSYLVSVSLNGENFSTEVMVIVFDSSCYSCNPATGACLYNTACSPSTTTVAATPAGNGLGPGEIAGIVVGSVVGVALIALLVALLVWKLGGRGARRLSVVPDNY